MLLLGIYLKESKATFELRDSHEFTSVMALFIIANLQNMPRGLAVAE